MIYRCRAVDASKYVQKYFNFDATVDRKPVQLLENWCDVVAAWCEGNYPGSDVLIRWSFFKCSRGSPARSAFP